MAALAEGDHRAALSRTSDAPGLIAEFEHALKSTAQGYLDAHHQILLAIDARR